MNNYTADQKRDFDRAKEYYNDAPKNIWTNPEVIRRILNGKAFECCPHNGLLGQTIAGYHFRYRGIPMNWD